MEALETTISYWEDALSAFTARNNHTLPLAVTSVEDSEFSRDVQRLLEAAYQLQEQSELLFLDQVGCTGLLIGVIHRKQMKTQ